MIKDVTVYLDGSVADDGRIEHAAAVCARFDAHLTALFLNALPSIVVAADVGAPAMIDWQMQEEAIASGDVAQTRLTERVARAAPLTEFRRRDLYAGRFGDAVAGLGRTGDLTVVSQPYGDGATELDPDVVEGALFGSGRGALIVPRTGAAPAEFRDILVAWRNSREAARAVAEAMPFLRRARRVSITMVDEQRAPAEDGLEPAADIARHLDRHGVTVEIRHLSRWDRPGEGLINEARLLGADMIVAGAYGHSRLREWVMGGTTRDLLTDCPVPLLMAH